MPTYGNINGAQKQIGDRYSNIGGARKQIQTMYANVGNARKIIYESGTDYWSIPYSDSGTLSSSTRYSRMVSTSATVNSSGTFTLQNATSQKGRPAAGTFMVSVSTSNSSSTTGTTLYYFYNSTGGYYAFSTNVTKQSSATAVSRVKSTTYTSDVVYDSNSNKLLLKILLVPAYYRWEKWENNPSYTETSSGSGTVTLYSGDTLTGSDSYYSDDRNGLFYLEEKQDGGYFGYSATDIAYQYENNHRDLTRSSYYHVISNYEYASIMYYNFSISSVSGDTVVLNYSRKYYFRTSSSSSLSGYVFSPNSSAYTTGSTYKNKTTL